MNDQTPVNEPQPASSEPSPIEDRHEQRRRERELRRQARWSRRGGNWIWGAVLILLGVVFFLENTGIFTLHNWWALFILIPAFASFAGAWNSYQDAGNRVTPAVRGAVIGGVAMVAIAFAFMFNVNWSIFLPVVLILGGLGLLLNAMLP